jgi:3-phosphoshikimate 1-carboxyvinyltransferase
VFSLEGGRPFNGRVRVPGDKSISHRAVILGALAETASQVRGRSDGDDVRHTEAVVRAMGARLEGDRIAGGDAVLHDPGTELDFGNSGTGMRLVAGVVASREWSTRLVGDGSLSARPMDRVARPLRKMGATVAGRTERCLPPLEIRGGMLSGLDYTPPEVSAQVKSCVLLAGLRARGTTVVREHTLTRKHTEELLARCGARIEEFDEEGAHVVRLEPGPLVGFDLDVPGDPSQAAFWLVAACVTPGSDVIAERVYSGPARRGFLEVLHRMGALVEEVPTTGPADLAATSDVRARSSDLAATEVAAAEIPSLDEVPVLAVAAARAEGTTVFRGVGELRVKESDRLLGVADMVNAFGASAEVEGDDLYVTGVPVLTAGDFDAHGDHRMAMAAAVAASAVPGRESRILRWEGIRTSYPAFRADLAELTGR